LIVGMAVLAVGILLFARGWVGGGDVKLLASASVWAGPALVFDLLVIMALSGGVLAVLVMLRGRNDAKRALPYGIAIAAGGVYVALHLASTTVARPLLG
jgi:prepilin peptidase CpaA